MPVYGIVNLENHALGAVLAVFGCIFAFDAGEGLEDVIGVVTVDAVQVEVCSIGQWLIYRNSLYSTMKRSML